ncbi:MAG: iron-containing alcohol dehydrogenase PsrA [Rhodospirillales bacterium]
MWTYANPVEIIFGEDTLNQVGHRLGGGSYCLVTYDEPYFSRLGDRISALAGPPAITVDTITPNPDFGVLEESCARFAEAADIPDVIVALGGGSVIDAAKVLAAALGDFSRVRRFLETGEGGDRLGAVPIVAIPTTAGTGSEVTCWATVWDTEAEKKYSLSTPGLYPRCALIDPTLMVSAPRDLTVSTGLDALSHSLESLWNRNANPVSAHHAVFAAREILAHLPALAEDLENRRLRSLMALAALSAGLAFSNTRTALAHSLSYPITLRYDVPHGVACSFSLPLVMRSVIGTDATCDASLRRIFGPDLTYGVERLSQFLTGLGVSTDPRDYGIDDDEMGELLVAAFAGERGQNFIGTRERISVVQGVQVGKTSTG